MTSRYRVGRPVGMSVFKESEPFSSGEYATCVRFDHLITGDRSERLRMVRKSLATPWRIR